MGHRPLGKAATEHCKERIAGHGQHQPVGLSITSRDVIWLIIFARTSFYFIDVIHISYTIHTHIIHISYISKTFSSFFVECHFSREESPRHVSSMKSRTQNAGHPWDGGSATRLQDLPVGAAQGDIAEVLRQASLHGVNHVNYHEIPNILGI